MRKNESTQKVSDCHGDPKSKKIGSSSSNADFNSTTLLNEPLSVSGDISSHASYQYNESRFSSPITSPNEVTPASEFEPSFVETNPTSFWVSPDLILDSSKVLIVSDETRHFHASQLSDYLSLLQDYPQLQSAIPDYFPQYEFPGSVTPWQSYEHKEISPSSSYSNFTGEIELSDNLNQIGGMSPYPGHSNYMDFFANEDMQYEGYDQTSSLSYLKPF